MNRALLLAAAILAIVACAFCFQSQDLINEINSHPLRLWKAKLYPQFNNMTEFQLKQRLLQNPKYYKHEQETLSAKELKALQEAERARRFKTGAPDAFDSRQQWADLKCLQILYVQDQGQCGSCWAFSAAEALGSRFCIASNGTVNQLMSAQDLVTCDHFNFGCKGGIPTLAYHYMQHTGVVDFRCMPYMIGGYTFCPSHCSGSKDTFKSHKYHLKSYKHIALDVNAIEEDIVKNGPASADFTVYSDFMNYWSGIYTRSASAGKLGGHAILIVGWGTDQAGTPYWIVQNSWGQNWGIHGYFWIIKGRNECGIEKDIFSGEPDLGRVPKF